MSPAAALYSRVLSERRVRPLVRCCIAAISAAAMSSSITRWPTSSPVGPERNAARVANTSNSHGHVERRTDFLSLDRDALVEVSLAVIEPYVCVSGTPIEFSPGNSVQLRCGQLRSRATVSAVGIENSSKRSRSRPVKSMIMTANPVVSTLCMGVCACWQSWCAARVRIWERSSSKVESRNQYRRFSMPRCPRIQRPPRGNAVSRAPGAAAARSRRPG